MTPLREGLRKALLTISLLGVLVFGGVLIVSFVAPLAVEQAAREVIRIEVERRVGERVDALSNNRLAGLASKALEKTTADADRVERELREQLPQRVVRAVADMLNADCECRKRLEERARQSHEGKLGTLRQAEARLSEWIEQAYAHTRDQLLRELRIFTAVNAVLFTLLGLLSLWKRASAMQLALIAVTLLGASAVAGGTYLFNQNWMHTLVFSSYVGWGYAIYLAAVTALFSDIAFNKGQVTAGLLSAITLPAC
jgi:hypothetical protein